MRKDGTSFRRWGITPLKTANTSSGITSPRFTISHLPPGWRCIRDRLTLDPVQNIIVRTRGLVYTGRDGTIPNEFLQGRGSPSGDPSTRSIPPLPRGGLHPLGALDLLPKGWACGPHFLRM